MNRNNLCNFYPNTNMIKDYVIKDSVNPFGYNYLRFLIINKSNRLIKENLIYLFDGLLVSPILFDYNEYLIIMYYNKDRVVFKDIVLSLSEDLGQMIKVFEGPKVNSINDMFVLVNIYNNCIKELKYNYYTIVDIIIAMAKIDRSRLNEIKNIVFKKYFEDPTFTNIIESLFISNLNISKAAELSYIHRNTMNNKIDTFENDTTISMKRFVDAVAIYELL